MNCYFTHGKGDAVIEFIGKLNAENHLIKFKYVINEDCRDSDEYFLASLNGDHFFVDITSKTSFTLIKLGEHGVTETRNITANDPEFYNLFFHNYDGQIFGWTPIFNTDYVNSLFSDTNLFYFSEVLGFGAGIMQFVSCDEDCIYFKKPDDTVSNVSLERILDILSWAYKKDISHIEHRGWSYESRQCNIDSVNKRAIYDLLNIIRPVTEIDKDSILVAHDDLIPYEIIALKQVYSYNNSLYKIYSITAYCIILEDIFNGDKENIKHEDITNLSPVTFLDNPIKQVSLENVMLFGNTDYHFVVKTADNTYTEFCPRGVYDYNEVYYLSYDNGHIFPKDVISVYRAFPRIGLSTDFDYSAIAHAALGHPYVRKPENE